MATDPKPSDIAQALNYMNRLIGGGIDFADAQWRVTQCYPQVSAEQIADAYDAQFEE